MKNRLLQMSLIVFLSGGIFANFALGMSFDHEVMFEEEFQSTTVNCRDVEEYGSGGLRARICANGTVAHCDWEDYDVPSTAGTCTLDGGGGIGE